MTRQLATIERISEILPIEGADVIQLARVKGWQSVIKAGAFNIDDPVVFIEVDAWVPTELAPFLTKEGKEPHVFNGIKGERLRTVKLRKQLSQGLILPVPDSFIKIEGTDCTEALGIQKWEQEVPLQLRGQVRGTFPTEIPKTDQERIQNIRLNDSKRADYYEITEKMHGASCTFYLDLDGEFHVCSRNMDLKPDENNAYWKAAIKFDVENAMRNLDLLGYAIQGELCGEGINGNNYAFDLMFLVFDIYSVTRIDYLLPPERSELTKELSLVHVPVIHKMADLPESIQHILEMADGESALNKVDREGLVFKSVYSNFSFKAVSNKWLLKHE